MHHAAQFGEGVELVAEVIHTLRGAVAEVRRRVWSGSAHLAAFSSRQPAHLDRLAVDVEIILAAVYNGHQPLADVLAQAGGVLAGRHKLSVAFQHQEQAALAVDAFRLGRQRPRDDLKVGELGNDTPSWHISVPARQIF